MDENKRKRVLCPIEKDGKTHWLKLGVAFVNKDNSINLYLDGLPTNGKLHVRDWDEAPWDKRAGANGMTGIAPRRDEPPLASQPQDEIPF